MDETNGGTARRRRRSRAEMAAAVAGYRESGLTQRAYAKQLGVSLASIGRWLHGKGQGGTAAPAGFAAVHLRAEPGAEISAVKIRRPEGIEMELPRRVNFGEYFGTAKRLPSCVSSSF